MNKQYYILTKDDDGHWYVVSVADVEEFNRRVVLAEDCPGFDDLDVTPLNGSFTRIQFSEWRWEPGY